jgi:hypothetical protein
MFQLGTPQLYSQLPYSAPGWLLFGSPDERAAAVFFN